MEACTMLQAHQVRNLFKDFSLHRVREAWTRALDMTEPLHYELDEVEKRNINLGIVQLAETWANPDYMYDSVSESLPDYAEIFRTKGEMKKALRNIEEVRAQTLENLETEDVTL
jgi:succinate dehydrogenase/fumarate reductase flavoprotein subunit